jgi:hypothetical protein
VPSPPPRCRRASKRGAAADDAGLPPRFQAGRRRRRCVIATTNAAALSPLRPQPRHRRRRAIAVTARGAASTVATPPPPLPGCQAAPHLHRATQRRHANAATAIATALPVVTALTSPLLDRGRLARGTLANKWRGLCEQTAGVVGQWTDSHDLSGDGGSNSEYRRSEKYERISMGVS